METKYRSVWSEVGVTAPGARPKRIAILGYSGTETFADKIPTYEEMTKIVGGFIELVNVLDTLRLEPRGIAPVYSTMIVNEEGLIKDLPRNDKATEVYQRNCRWAFPDAPNPFAAARERHLLAMAGKVIFVDPPASAGGAAYNDDPYISGNAIYFEGWDAETVGRALNGEEI